LYVVVDDQNKNFLSSAVTELFCLLSVTVLDNDSIQQSIKDPTTIKLKITYSTSGSTLKTFTLVDSTVVAPAFPPSTSAA
jgi:hypothetical protein